MIVAAAEAGPRSDNSAGESLSLCTSSDLLSSFDGFDTDRDGRLAPEEALPLFTFLLPFQKLDTDLDGRLTLSEFQEVAAERLASAGPEERKKAAREGRTIFAGLDLDGAPLDPHPPPTGPNGWTTAPPSPHAALARRRARQRH